MDENKTTDRSYGDATTESYATHIAKFFFQLIRDGLSRQEALILTKTMMQTLHPASEPKSDG